MTLTPERIDSILLHFDTLPPDRQREVIARLALDKEELRDSLILATDFIRLTAANPSESRNALVAQMDEVIRRTRGVSP